MKTLNFRASSRVKFFKWWRKTTHFSKMLESITIDNFKELIKMKAAKTIENVDSFEKI
jgi:hypothetical protein